LIEKNRAIIAESAMAGGLLKLVFAEPAI